MALDLHPRYVRAALFHGLNLTALGAAVAASLLTLSPLPALLALGGELVYLGTVPSLPGFKRRVERQHSKQRGAEAARRAEEMLQELSPSQREHFFTLRDLKERVLENHRRLGSSGLLMLSSEQRIDSLLASFLRLLSTLNAYRKYLSQANREQVERELDELLSDLQREPGPGAQPQLETAGRETGTEVREVQEKRAEILRKRLARFDQAAGHRELMSHQLASIEDLLRLLHEQSIGLRDPEVVNRQLETVTAEVESTESTVRALQDFLAFEEPAVLPPEPPRERAR